MRYRFSTPAVIALSLLATACVSAPAGDKSRPDVFSEGRANTRQEVREIEIIALRPATINASNREAREKGQVAGAVLGGIAGATDSGNAAILGAAAGAGIANLVTTKDKLVDGVSITFRDEGATYVSVQVGQICEYKLGKTTMISGALDETRIQPNGQCPKK